MRQRRTKLLPATGPIVLDHGPQQVAADRVGVDPVTRSGLDVALDHRRVVWRLHLDAVAAEFLGRVAGGIGLRKQLGLSLIHI